MELAKVEKVALPAGRRTLVISDIHGNLDFFKALLRQVRFSREDTLILLGDVLEKGVDSLATLRYVMELKKDHMVHMLCGNCDNLAYNFVDQVPDIPPSFYESYVFGWGEKCVLWQMAEEAGGFSGPAPGHPGAVCPGTGLPPGPAHHPSERTVPLCPRRRSPGGPSGGAARLALHEK